jgi:hypothetical protein
MSAEKLIDKFKIELNQNLWAVIITFLSLGLSEYYDLSHLFCLSYILAIVCTISFIITIVFYTWKYCYNKVKEK